MRMIYRNATRVARRWRLAGLKTIDDLAAELISAGYMYHEQYLEMKHLDPIWMVATRIYTMALYKALGPASSRTQFRKS